MVRIDFSKAGKYESKEWLAMKEKKEKNIGKIDYWKASSGEPYIVKHGRLYYGSKMVYQQKGWGMESGSTLYLLRRGKYFTRHYSNIIDEMRRIMKPFKIPIVTSR